MQHNGSPLVRQWSFWSLIAVGFLLAVDVGAHFLDFPLRLLLLQLEVWLVEKLWRNRRISAETRGFGPEYSAI